MVHLNGLPFRLHVISSLGLHCVRFLLGDICFQMRLKPLLLVTFLSPMLRCVIIIALRIKP